MGRALLNFSQMYLAIVVLVSVQNLKQSSLFVSTKIVCSDSGCHHEIDPKSLVKTTDRSDPRIDILEDAYTNSTYEQLNGARNLSGDQHDVKITGNDRHVEVKVYKESKEFHGKTVIKKEDGIRNKTESGKVKNDNDLQEELKSQEEINVQNWKSFLIRNQCKLNCYGNLTVTYESTWNDTEKQRKCALNCVYDNAKNYTQQFFQYGDFEIGQIALNLTEEYVNGTRNLLRNSQLAKPLSLIVCYSCVGMESDIDKDASELYETQRSLKVLQKLNYLLEGKMHFLKLVNSTDQIVKLHESTELHLKTIATHISRFENVGQIISEVKLLLEKQNLTRNFSESFWTDNFLSMQQWEEDTTLLRNRYQRTIKKLNEIRTHIIFQHHIDPAIFLVIFLIGFVGNGTLLLIFAKHPEIRTAPNVIIFNISLSDILSYVINLFLRHLILHSSISFKLVGAPCTMYTVISFILFFVSALSVVGLSVQRYYATAKIHHTPAITNRPTRYSVLFVLLTWVISVLTSVIFAFGGNIGMHVCEAEYKLDVKKQLATYLVFMCLFALSLMCVFNYLTSRQLKRSQNVPGEIYYYEREKSRQRSFIVINALTIVCFISYVPRLIYHLLRFWLNLDEMEITFQCINKVTFYLLFAQSCFNPISLYMSSSTFRRLYDKYLFPFKGNQYRRTKEDKSIEILHEVHNHIRTNHRIRRRNLDSS